MADARTRQLEQLKQLCLEAEQLRDAAQKLCADLGEQLSRAHPDQPVDHPSDRRRQDRRNGQTRRRSSERRVGSRRAPTA